MVGVTLLRLLNAERVWWGSGIIKLGRSMDSSSDKRKRHTILSKKHTDFVVDINSSLMHHILTFGDVCCKIVFSPHFFIINQ